MLVWGIVRVGGGKGGGLEGDVEMLIFIGIERVLGKMKVGGGVRINM